MSIPVFKWRKSTSRYALPSADSIGLMSALNTAVTTEGVHWGVNHFDGTTDRHVELKLNAPSSGEMSTFRALLFGSPSTGAPNAAALDGDATSRPLYQYICVDANTGSGGPPVSYKTGDPYAGATGSSKGFRANGVTISASSTLAFAESQIGFWWSVSDGNPASAVQSLVGGFGYLWDHFGSYGWISAASVSFCPVAYPTIVSSGFHIPALQTKTAVDAQRIIGVKTGLSTVWELGRTADVPGCSNGFNGSALYRPDGGLLVSATLTGRVRGSGAGGLDGSYMGRLRQIKYGPSAIDRAETEDTIFLGGSTSSVGAGIHLDHHQA